MQNFWLELRKQLKLAQVDLWLLKEVWFRLFWFAETLRRNSKIPKNGILILNVLSSRLRCFTVPRISAFNLLIFSRFINSLAYSLTFIHHLPIKLRKVYISLKCLKVPMKSKTNMKYVIMYTGNQSLKLWFDWN